ncbi:roadblock/LC7 domain-containing protein [candidate division CSSED10-310 bacterium]|uniref:Roadblock/LC7 domain-containing protein n=1 Tax=candidate division CSSED10-310 bacterium TaxID=2855610 RepID=A0ABV6Z3X6_UNCC1
MLKEGLKKIIENVDGALGVLLLGVDGLPIVEIKKKQELDIGVLAAELTMLYKNAQRTIQNIEFGALQEVSVVAEKTVVICRAVTEEYYLMLAITPDALAGKGRYLLRKSVEDFKELLL